MNRPTNILGSGVGGSSGTWLSGYDQRIEFTVESDRFTSDLTSPVRLVLSIGAGIDSTDVPAVFDELSSSYARAWFSETSGIFVSFDISVGW